MKHYLALVCVMVALLLGLFALAVALEVPLLTEPGPWLARGGAAGAAVGVALLVVDVFVPVPSSLVMMALGAAFGAALGTVLSLAGGLGAGWLGFFVGRRGGPLLERVIPAEERARGDLLLEQWGGLAVVVSRPVPILAETVAIMAGTSPMSWGEMTLATAAGSIPAALIYGLAGALASNLLDNFLLVLALVLLVAGPLWWLGRRTARAVETGAMSGEQSKTVETSSTATTGGGGSSGRRSRGERL